jgi:hypothetical protein
MTASANTQCASITVIYVAGLDGQVELLMDRVIIHRKGFINTLFHGFNSRREIPIGAISEVMFRDATRLKFGVIEFVRSGRSNDERKGNACIVKFNRAQAASFEKIKEKAFLLIEHNAKQKNT